MNTQWNQYKTVEQEDNIKGFLCVFDVVIIVFRGTFQMHFSKAAWLVADFHVDWTIEDHNLV